MSSFITEPEFTTFVNPTVTLKAAQVPGSDARFLLECGSTIFDSMHDYLHDALVFAGTQELQDTYFDTKNMALYRQGWVCCCSQSLGLATLSLYRVDEDGSCSSKVDAMSYVRGQQDIVITTLPQGALKKRLKALLGSIKLKSLFSINVIRNHYQLKTDFAQYNVRLDSVFTLGEKSSVNELTISSQNPSVDLPQDFIHKLKQAFYLTKAPGDHFQRLIKAKGLWLKRLQKNIANN